MREAAAEFGVCTAQGLFGIDFREAGEVDDGEKDVAHFVFGGVGGASGKGFAVFSDFLFELGEDLFGVVPVEAGARGAGGDLLGFEEGGLGSWDAVEEAFGFVVLLLLFGGLDGVPEFQDFVAGAGGFVAEDVGVAADELGVDRVEAVGEGEVAFFGGHLGVEDGLEDEVAELIAEVDPVAAVDGVEDFVGFFDGVLFDGVEVLFAVPGAAIGGAKAGHDVEELVEFVAGAGGVVGHGWYEGSIGRHDLRLTFHYARSASMTAASISPRS